MWQRTKDLIRNAGHRAKVAVSAHDRVLPDFIIVGAQKAGTTSLHHYLQQHPLVLPPSSKEVHYFDYGYSRGENWYRGHFARTAEKLELETQLGAAVLTFEASPYYMYHPLAIERMAADLPGVRVIAMLRDPIDRTFSHYWHEKKKDQDDLSLAEAIAQEPERLAGEAEKIRQDPAYQSWAHQHFSYVDRSRYAPQVERLQTVLGAENVCLIKSEAFFADPETETERVFGFLELEPAHGIDYAPQNVGGYDDRIPADVRASLRKIFAQDYARLRQIVGPQFDWFED